MAIFENIKLLRKHLDEFYKERPVYMTSGGFDPLHIGHVRCILGTKSRASNADIHPYSMKGITVVVVNADSFLIRKKGFAFMPLQERMEIIDSIKGVDFVVQPKLVRGLDYYSGLVYEWIPKVDPEQVTAQATICGGGRYNDLFSSLGATATSACGFSIGLERLLMHIEADTLVQEYPEKVLLVSTLDLAHYHSATSCSEMLRSDFKGLTVHQLAPQANMKSLLKQAMKWNAHYCIIAGASSDEQTPLLLKCMRSAKQVALNTTQLQQFFAEERML